MLDGKERKGKHKGKDWNGIAGVRGFPYLNKVKGAEKTEP